MDFAKAASRYLRLPSQKAAKIAEDLYAAGAISYPRTETQVGWECVRIAAIRGLVCE